MTTVPRCSTEFVITDIEIKLPARRQQSSLLAWVSIVINESFKVRGIRLLQLDSGRIFLAFPEKLLKHDNVFISIAHPLTSEVRNYCTECVWTAYQWKLKSASLEIMEATS